MALIVNEDDKINCMRRMKRSQFYDTPDADQLPVGKADDKVQLAWIEEPRPVGGGVEKRVRDDTIRRLISHDNVRDGPTWMLNQASKAAKMMGVFRYISHRFFSLKFSAR